MMKRIKMLTLLLLTCLGSMTVFGQTTYEPKWSYQSNYSRTMTISAQATSNKVVCVGSHWEWGAFIDDECRFSRFMDYEGSLDQWVGYISVQFNQEDEGKLVVIRLYDHINNKEYVMSEKLPAEKNKIYGSPFYMFYFDSNIIPPSEDGDGTVESPYLISNANEFIAFTNYSIQYNSNVYGQLTGNIDLTDKNIEMMGKDFPYGGVFDGGGFTVKGMKINNTDGYTGFVGQLSGTIKNLNLESPVVISTSNYATGTVVGFIDDGGMVEKVFCHNASASNSGTGATGGLVGSALSGSVTRSGYVGSITAQSACGGLVGETLLGSADRFNMESCYFYGTIDNKGDGPSGGIIGKQAADIKPTNFFNTDLCSMNPAGQVTGGSQLPSSVVGRTTEQFKSGEIAYIMDWGQDLSVPDPYPYPYSYAYKPSTGEAGIHVYQVKKYTKKGDPNIVYVNSTLEAEQGSNALYFCDAEIPGLGGRNIVNLIDGAYHCEELQLTEEVDFYTPVDFIAEKASYTRTPKVYADGQSGWETIVLPFDVTKYEASINGVIVPFWNSSATEPASSTNLNADGAFWVKYHSGSQSEPNATTGRVLFDFLRESPNMKANVSYIIAFPGQSFGNTSLEGQSITFSAENVKVLATPDPGTSAEAIGDFAFHPTFEHIASNAFVLNDAGNTFATASSAQAVLPFKAYIEVQPTIGSTVSSLSIGSAPGGSTGLEFEQLDPEVFAVVGGKGAIRVTSSNAQQVQIFTPLGCLHRIEYVEAGETEYNGFLAGIYIINGIKVIVK